MRLQTSLAVFMPVLIAAVSAHCHDGPPLNNRFRPMHYDFFAFGRLDGVQALTIASISEVYTNVIELSQSVYTLKGELGVRIQEDIPPPHHTCFIIEYSEERISYMENFTLTEDAERLSEDLQTLERFQEQFDRTIRYENEVYRNQYAAEMTNVQDRYLSIINGLRNMTQTVTPPTDPAPSAVHGGHLNEIPAIPAPEPSTPYHELFHQADINIQPTTQAPPTLPECANAAMDHTLQYIIYFEFWQALYYLQMDLANAKQRYT